MKRTIVLALVAAVFSATAVRPAMAQAKAYVTNLNSNTVSVINTATKTVQATVGVGDGPYGIALTPDGGFAYVTNARSTNVSVVNTTTNTLVATIGVGSSPRSVAITPDGAFAYVANRGSNNVSVINTATMTVVATIPVGSLPFGVAITPDGAFAYVTNNASSGTVSIIDTASKTVVATVSVGSLPFGVAMAPNGAFAYVANQASNFISVIDTASKTVVAPIPIPAGVNWIAVTPDGALAYVGATTNTFPGKVWVLDTVSKTVVATISVGPVPDVFEIGITPDGALVLVTDPSGNSVAVIDRASNTVVATVPVGGSPVGVALPPPVALPPTPFLDFPLHSLGPYNHAVSSVFDHHVESDEKGPEVYANDNDGVVKAYDGEEGVKNCGHESCLEPNSGLRGYKNTEDKDFRLANRQYTGGGGCLTPPGCQRWLFYEGHPGFDYPAPPRKHRFLRPLMALPLFRTLIR